MRGGRLTRPDHRHPSCTGGRRGVKRCGGGGRRSPVAGGRGHHARSGHTARSRACRTRPFGPELDRFSHPPVEFGRVRTVRSGSCRRPRSEGTTPRHDILDSYWDSAVARHRYAPLARGPAVAIANELASAPAPR